MQSALSAQREQARQIESLLQHVAEFQDQEARATTEELIQTLMDMYGQGLTRMLEITAQSASGGQDLIDTLANDDLVGSLLLLHGLHPQPLEERLIQTLNEFQKYLQKHDGKAELLKVEQGVAFIRLEARSKGCSSTLQLLQSKLEETLYEALPDLEDIRVEGVVEPVVNSHPVKFVPRRAKSQPSAGSEPTKQAVK